VITFGSWIRAVHRNLGPPVVIVVALHLIRVFLTAPTRTASAAADSAKSTG